MESLAEASEISKGSNGDAQSHARRVRVRPTGSAADDAVRALRSARSLVRQAAALAITEAPEVTSLSRSAASLLDPLHERGDEARGRRERRLHAGERAAHVEERDPLQRSPGDEPAVAQRDDDARRLERAQDLAHVVLGRPELGSRRRPGRAAGRPRRTPARRRAAPGRRGSPSRPRLGMDRPDERGGVLEHEGEPRAEEQDRPGEVEPEEEDRDRGDGAVDRVVADDLADPERVRPTSRAPTPRRPRGPRTADLMRTFVFGTRR